MIKTFRHGGLKSFFDTGSKKGIQPTHAKRLAQQLLVLDAASRPEDMRLPGWGLHSLTGQMERHWSVKVNGNWRLTFRFEEGNAIVVDYQDYH